MESMKIKIRLKEKKISCGTVKDMRREKDNRL